MVVHIDEIAVNAVRDDVVRSADPRRDARRSRGHRFQRDEAEALPP